MGFQEILVILLVAMIAIGPVKVVDFAKKAGKFTRDIKRTSDNIMSDLNREIEEEEKKITETKPAEKRKAPGSPSQSGLSK
jgi:Sec-independent protein translocase protein TatA